MNKEKEPVIIIENVNDRVKIENDYEYSVNLSFGLAEGNDFYLEINFKELSNEDYKRLIKFGKQPNRLKFESDIIIEKKYNITHIVVTETNANSLGEISWKCLSDDPNLYKDFLE